MEEQLILPDNCGPPSYDDIIPQQHIQTQTAIGYIPQVQGNQSPTIIYVTQAEKCPKCHKFDSMKYEDVISERQHWWALALFLSGVIFAWIPYVTTNCLFHKGTCKKCGYVTKDTTNNKGLKVLISFLTGVNCAILIIIFMGYLITP